MGKHEGDLQIAFTVTSNIQIMKRELTSGKIRVLLFNFLKYGAWKRSFSALFYVKDFC